MLRKNLFNIGFTLIAFFGAFLSGPFAHLDMLTLMPGGVGDARLNNYFLENIYQFIIGRSESLWNLGFYSPYPYVLGFSDNLFGSAPVYLFARGLFIQSDTAFQLWFLFGYSANYIATYYALRQLGASSLAATIGALIFAFALPTTAHAGHAQLHYRFGAPLAIVFFVQFLNKKDWHFFEISGAWLVWQFYCGIYIGFFTLLVLVGLLMGYFAYSALWEAGKKNITFSEFGSHWQVMSSHKKVRIIVSLSCLCGAVILLFYPYIQVKNLYHIQRSWAEVASMLPRPQSYFLSDVSLIWSSQAGIFSGIPMRHEHQMFFGAIPLVLAIFGFISGSKNRNGLAYPLLVLSLVGLVIVSLYMGRLSMWYLFAKMPLASAIRAMTRIDLVLLFPIAYLATISIDRIRSFSTWGSKLVCAVIIPLLVFEFSLVTPQTSPKKVWRDRVAQLDAIYPRELPPNAIVFFPQLLEPIQAAEIDAMWVALNRAVPTLNGYSGDHPPGYSGNYQNYCNELPKRVLSYLRNHGRRDDKEAYLNLMRRIVPIGLVDCDSSWWEGIPEFSESDKEYTAEDIINLNLFYSGRDKLNEQSIVNVGIKNSGDKTIAAYSSIGKPVRLSWRFLDLEGRPVGIWETRKGLPSDIKPGGAINVKIPIDNKMEIKGGSLQVSLVQEAAFWAHDIGLAPLTIYWD